MGTSALSYFGAQAKREQQTTRIARLNPLGF